MMEIPNSGKSMRIVDEEPKKRRDERIKRNLKEIAHEIIP